MKRKILWILIFVVVVAAVGTIFVIRQQCMTKCIAEFQGYYPDVACKYECSFFSQFKKPVKR